MARNRNKVKQNGAKSMDISENAVSAMGASESGAPKSACGAFGRKKMKGRPMKRSKNVRKMKALAKAIAQNEKVVEKVLKNERKSVRAQSAKLLYD